MNQKIWLLIIVPTLCLALAITQRGFAQSASESFDQAGHSVENAGSSVGHAVVHVYHGTVTATKDTAITTAVKTALLADVQTKAFHIHVKTIAGVVTLRGRVASRSVADRAEHIAATTDGVARVRNWLHVKDTGSASN
ncbi:MAG: BON domain-containing protein [Candidatus Binataceae bacterium]